MSGCNSAEEKGREEAIEIGEARREARGEAKGKIEIAKNLLKTGLTIDLIANYTALAKEEIEILKVNNLAKP